MTTPGATVEVVAGDTVSVTLRGRLDASIGHLLLGVATSARECGIRHLDVDLSAVVAAQPEGVSAIGACRAICRQLADGVTFHVRTAAGREALLASLDAEPPAALAGVTD